MTGKLASVLLVVSISLLTACERSADSSPSPVIAYDTIYPKSYLPCWPGSWWMYIDDRGDTTYSITDSVWRRDHYVESGAAYSSDTFYVPVLDGIPIWGYEAHTGPISNAGSHPLTRILDDTLAVGSTWLIHAWAGTSISRRIHAKDTTLQHGSISYFPTLVVDEYYSTGPSGNPLIARRYYTEGVGMVREDLYTLNDTTVHVKWLEARLAR